MSALLEIDGVSKHFGGFTALDGVSIGVGQGERFGLIGPNGSGKTTLINCISGALTNDSGSIRFDGEEISRLPAYLRTRRGIAEPEGAAHQGRRARSRSKSCTGEINHAWRSIRRQTTQRCATQCCTLDPNVRITHTNDVVVLTGSGETKRN